ncbi:hypothetical protein KSS87_001905 [Heliosperma pusillum]|nr:hypothetical protein KSS87_001905 [Heliosperma pusillum]
MGGAAGFAGKLGANEFGWMLAGILKENGVNAELKGNPSADMLLRPDELNLDLIRKAKIFHYGSISLIAEPCRSAHLKAMEEAKAAGALLSLKSIIKVSDNELEFLTENNDICDATAMSLWHPNLKLLLVTLGDQGCRYYTKTFKGSVEAFKVKAVDTTGAGDSFIGALLSKIVDDHSIIEDEPRLRQAVKFANACGAITTTKKGAIPALPTEAETMEFIKNNS